LKLHCKLNHFRKRLQRASRCEYTKSRNMSTVP
jgi:hypothetical protein